MEVPAMRASVRTHPGPSRARDIHLYQIATPLHLILPKYRYGTGSNLKVVAAYSRDYLGWTSLRSHIAMQFQSETSELFDLSNKD